MNEQNAVILINFLEQYNGFLVQMLGNEREKLLALSSDSLPRIEHSITVAQADEMQMQNLEQKRMKLLKGIGCNEFTISQLVEACPDAQRSQLEILCEEVRQNVNEIKFHNNKSMDLAQANMRRTNPLAAPINQTTTGANPYKSANLKREDSATILETKV